MRAQVGSRVLILLWLVRIAGSLVCKEVKKRRSRRTLPSLRLRTVKHGPVHRSTSISPVRAFCHPPPLTCHSTYSLDPDLYFRIVSSMQWSCSPPLVCSSGSSRCLRRATTNRSSGSGTSLRHRGAIKFGYVAPPFLSFSSFLDLPRLNKRLTRFVFPRLQF